MLDQVFPTCSWIRLRGLLARGATGTLRVRIEHGRVVDDAFEADIESSRPSTAVSVPTALLVVGSQPGKESLYERPSGTQTHPDRSQRAARFPRQAQAASRRAKAEPVLVRTARLGRRDGSGN